MNSKIIELIIQDGDEEAGLDGIALVELPAHEAQFEYFSEVEEPQKYVLSEEELEPALKMFSSYGEPQGLLESEGWQIVSVEKMNKQKFASITSEPNKDSPIFDTPTQRIRFKYVGPQDEKNRPFCADMMSLRRVFRIEDIDAMSRENINPVGPIGYDLFEWRGSYNCRHGWVKLVYAKEGTIINNDKVKRGVLYEEGVPGPDTRTTATIDAGNTPPRDFFNKTKMEVNVSGLSPYVEQITDEVEKKPVLTAAEGNINIFGYKTRFFHICPVAVELFQHLASMPMDGETTGMVRSAAQVADNVFRIEDEAIKNNSVSMNDLIQAAILVEDFKDIIHEIDEEVGMSHDVSFMDGHVEKIASFVNKENMELEDACWEGYEPIGTKTLGGREVPNCVPIKANKEQFESYNDYPDAAKNNACKVLKWRDEYGDEVKGMTQIGWTRANQLCKGENISEETIARMSAFQRHQKNADVAPEFKSTPWKDAGYVAWLGWGGTTGINWASNKLKSIRNDMSFSVFNAEQRMVVGPAMIPDKMIIRRNEITGEIYYVYFTAETIKKLQEKFMKEKLLDATNIEHGRKFLKDVDVIESWIVEDSTYDKQKVFDMDYPKGTWMITMKVNNPEVWEKVKDGKLKGFSVQGYFMEKAKFNQQDIIGEIKKIITESK